jgi:hypothetical protein
VPLRARARSPVTLRAAEGFRAARPSSGGWPGRCDGEETKQAQRTSQPREHAMMIAFVMAVVGIAVLGTMNLVAAR